MAIPAFTLPYTDADLTDANEVVVEFNGGGNEVVVLPLPGSGNRYYNYKTVGASRSDSIVKVFTDALSAKIGRTVTPYELTGSVLPGVLGLQIAQPTASLDLKWAHSSSNLDPAIFGFPASTVSAVGNTITATWPLGRMWLPRGAMWLPSWPEDEVWVGSKTLVGRREDLHLASGPNTRAVKASQYPLARVLLWAAAHADWHTAVQHMVQGDPNTPFEAFWWWLAKRKPIRYHEDRDDDTAFEELQVKDLKLVSSLLNALTSNLRDAGSNPLADLRFDLEDYVS